MSQFFRKYRGKVVNNADLQNRGRILVNVPDVLGSGTGWALPSAPYAGLSAGIFAVPPIDANVWVEFEGGNPDRPIWTGCFWEAGETPAIALAGPPIAAAARIVLQPSVSQQFIAISDAPGAVGGITLMGRNGAMITINDTGIIITNGRGATITLTQTTVDINVGALTVM